MSDSYVTISGRADAELVEKKSRFIARLEHVDDMAEAERILEEERKKYYDARHHCSAFITGACSDVKRMSDDGEPQGTAGKPMLEVLDTEGITFVCVVVTRYFGGTLLGTGGLSRAYSGACKLALEQAVRMRFENGHNLRIRTDYNDIGKILHTMGEFGLEADESIYAEAVELGIWLPDRDGDIFEKRLTDVTSGKVIIDKGNSEFRGREIKVI